ncbi:MAG: Holliday junction branch migration protein RuvA [Bacteroidetes bacterium]|nr:Holliday junction branch migration protein RuvA [Bacteroidota bacterium]
MIAYITGPIAYKSPTVVIIESGSIGYEIQISLNTWSQIQKLDSCKLFTYFHVKEDAHTLYGFADEQEKAIFSLLISVSGVGPNTARMMLSTLRPNEITNAILTEDEVMISSVKGIGPKSAKRIILELKDKIAKTTPEAAAIASHEGNTLRSEALTALAVLGFSKSQAEKAIDKTLKMDEAIKSVEDLIKQSLKNM